MDPCTVGVLLSSECHRKTYKKSVGLIPIKELTPRDREILELRAGVFLSDDANLCFHHYTWYLTYVYISRRRRCCDPFGRHMTKHAKKQLKIISYGLMKQVKKKIGKQLICGQKLCISCKIRLNPPKYGKQPHLYWKRELDYLLKRQRPAWLPDSHMDPTEDQLPRRTKRKILWPLEKIEVKKKNEQRGPKPPKRLRLKAYERLQLLLLESNNPECSGTVSSSTSTILPSSLDSNDINRTGTSEQKCSGLEAMLVQNLKRESVEEHEILGPQLTNLLDPTTDNDNEDISIMKIKKESLDEVPKLEPNVEMTFEFEESAVNYSKSESLEDTSDECV